MDAWERMYRDEEEALSFFLSQEFRGVVTVSLSQDTSAMVKAISRQFARRVVKEAAMDVRYIPVIPCEDEPVHTDERPWCRDASCPCHDVVTGDEYQNEAYHRLIVRPLMAGLITATEANRIFFDEQV